MSARFDRIVSLFETFAPADIDRLGAYYTEDAYFKDPFNEVRGLEAIQRIYAHMFRTLDTPRFIVTQQMAAGNECWLAWEFQFQASGSGATQVVRGASNLVLDAEGRILSHRDYWDAAEEVYEKVPVLGALMRWLKRRIAA